MRDLNRGQSQLLFKISTFLGEYEPPELQPLIDDDVADATAALAATLETASRGLIYEHRPAALPADRLTTALKPLIAQAGGSGGSAFERDAAVVLRRIAETVRETRALAPSNRRAYLELLGRILKTPDANEDMGSNEIDPPRLIVP